MRTKNSNFFLIILCYFFVSGCATDTKPCGIDNKVQHNFEKSLFFTNNFNLDSAWYYVIQTIEGLDNCPQISKFHFEVYDQFQKLCINKRKITLGISYALQLCKFDNYNFIPSHEYKSRAFQNAGFYFFRFGENGKSEKYNNLALEHALKAKNPKLVQEAYLSQFFNYITWTDIHNESKISKINHIDSLYIQSVNEYGDLANYNRAKGYFFYDNNEFNPCISSYQKAIQFELNKEYPNKPVLYSLYYQLSESYEKVGYYEKALETYKNVTDKRFSFINDLRIAEIYYSKYKESGELKDWSNSYKHLLTSDSSQYSQMSVILEDDVLVFFNYSNQINKLGMSLAYDWYKTGCPIEAVELFYTFSEKNKNTLMQQEHLLTRTNFIKDENLKKDAIVLNKSIRRANANGLDFGKNFDSDILELEKIYSNIEEKSGDLLKLNLPPLSKLLEWSNSNQTQIISMNVLDDKILVMTISAGGLKLEEVLFGSEISERINAFIKYHSGDIKLNAFEYQKLAYGIYSKVFSGVLDNSEKIVYSPDGIFNFLNMETLVSDTSDLIINFSDLEYLIHDYQIKYSSDIRSILKQKNNKPKGKIAVFSFTDNNTLGSEISLSELPATIGTANSVKKMYSDTKIFSGKQATKSNFIKALNNSDFSTIHIALHGASSGNTREDVKLFFRKPSGEIDTLYGYELLGMQSSADRIILASCESAKGIFELGEGAYTLNRYFHSMGIDEVISQLWDSEDVSSAYLYKKYFIEYDLRKAKLAMLDIPQFSFPNVWGNVINN